MDKLSRYAPYALAALRIVTALLFILQGTAKLFGFPEMASHGPGPSSPGGLSLLTFVGALLELFRGLALLAGFLTRPVAFLLAGEMAVAYLAMHVPMGGFFPLSNGGDLALAVLLCLSLFDFRRPWRPEPRRHPGAGPRLKLTWERRPSQGSRNGVCAVRPRLAITSQASSAVSTISNRANSSRSIVPSSASASKLMMLCQ
jgi:putative oxidoreductase